MKKKLVILAAICSMAVAVHAKTLRVSNVDPSASYATITAAVNAAVDGDTIMVEGTSKDYDETTLDKKVVLIGPGYWLRENGIGTEAAQSANIQSIITTQEGTVIMGVHVWGNIQVDGSKTIIARCCIDGGVSIKKDVTNCIIRQNFIKGDVGSGYDHSFYHQITNNIFGNVACKGVNESYIAYNTSYAWWGESLWNSYNCKVEKNIVFTNEFTNNTDNSYTDNYVIGEYYKDINTDKDVLNTELPADATSYGAFTGNDPYVISGIPTGPMIEELIVPASAEEGSIMEVTIKLGKAK